MNFHSYLEVFPVNLYVRGCRYLCKTENDKQNNINKTYKPKRDRCSTEKAQLSQHCSPHSTPVLPGVTAVQLLRLSEDRPSEEWA